MTDPKAAYARERRDWHLAQAAKYDTYLQISQDLEAELSGKAPAEERPALEREAAPPRKRQATRPREGIGADTINAAELIVRDKGPMSTRDLLPLVRDMGIEVGGNDPVATLSARISNKGDLVTYNGKWHFKDELPAAAFSGAGRNEAADNLTKDQSAASSVFSNQGGPHGTALI